MVLLRDIADITIFQPRRVWWPRVPASRHHCSCKTHVSVMRSTYVLCAELFTCMRISRPQNAHASHFFVARPCPAPLLLDCCASHWSSSVPRCHLPRLGLPGLLGVSATPTAMVLATAMAIVAAAATPSARQHPIAGFSSTARALKSRAPQTAPMATRCAQRSPIAMTTFSRPINSATQTISLSTSVKVCSAAKYLNWH